MLLWGRTYRFDRGSRGLLTEVNWCRVWVRIIPDVNPSPLSSDTSRISTSTPEFMNFVPDLSPFYSRPTCIDELGHLWTETFLDGVMEFSPDLGDFVSQIQSPERRNQDSRHNDRSLSPYNFGTSVKRRRRLSDRKRRPFILPDENEVVKDKLY